jgi:hypothetical protein
VRLAVCDDLDDQPAGGELGRRRGRRLERAAQLIGAVGREV